MTTLPDGLKARIVETIYVDWYDLDAYLSNRYQCPSTHGLPLECRNDTDHHVSPSDTEKPYDDWDEALEKYKSGNMEEYYMHALLSAAVRDGHLPLGDYLIRVSW